MKPHVFLRFGLALLLHLALTRDVGAKQLRALTQNDFLTESSTPCMKNELGQDAYPCDIERNSRNMVRKWVAPTATVLEIGARYGSVSCVIAAKQQQSGKLVAVEPDPLVASTLQNNVQVHGCRANVLKGVVGTTPVSVVHEGNGGYGTRTVGVSNASQANHGSGAAPAYPLAQVEATFQMHFDTVVADCEGCLPTLFTENPQLAQQVNLILAEAHTDAESASVVELQSKYGFQLVDQMSRQVVLSRAHH